MFHSIETREDFGNLKQRLLTEVELAVSTALELMDVLGSRQMSIHLDINSDPKHKSHTVVKEATAWVLGTTGIMPEFKPNSQIASRAADHMVKLGSDNLELMN